MWSSSQKQWQQDIGTAATAGNKDNERVEAPIPFPQMGFWSICWPCRSPPGGAGSCSGQASNAGQPGSPPSHLPVMPDVACRFQWHCCMGQVF